MLHSKDLSKPNYLQAVPTKPITKSPDEVSDFDGFFGDDVSDETVYDAQIVDAVPYDAKPVERVEFSKTIMPLVCPTCHIPISDDAHGWLVTRASRTSVGGKVEIVPCPTCSGDAQQKRQSRLQAQLVQRLFGGADIPWSMRDWDFTSFPFYGDQEAREHVQAFIQAHMNGERKRRGLWLGGDLGRGKTSLAVSSLKEVIRNGHLGLFVLTADLFNRIRASFGDHAKEHSDELLEAVQTVPWLVLDDIGVERPTPYVIEQFYSIISLRMQRGLYTIFTSNFNPRDLENYWCEDPKISMNAHRIIARLREYCAGIAAKGQNLREKAR